MNRPAVIAAVLAAVLALAAGPVVLFGACSQPTQPPAPVKIGEALTYNLGGLLVSPVAVSALVTDAATGTTLMVQDGGGVTGQTPAAAQTGAFTATTSKWWAADASPATIQAAINRIAANLADAGKHP